MVTTSVAVGELVSVIYVSSATCHFSTDALKSMLTAIRCKNEQHGITGMLLYRDGNFLQILEGPAEAIDQLLADLKRDSRHRGILLMRRKAIRQREFGQWQMAFRDINGQDLSHVVGYSRFMEMPFASAEFQADVSIAYKLLQDFKQRIR